MTAVPTPLVSDVIAVVLLDRETRPPSHVMAGQSRLSTQRNVAMVIP